MLFKGCALWGTLSEKKSFSAKVVVIYTFISARLCCEANLPECKYAQFWPVESQICTVLTNLSANMHCFDLPGDQLDLVLSRFTHFFSQNLLWFMHCYMENFAVQIFKHFPCLCQAADIHFEVGLYPVVPLFLLFIYKWQFLNLFLSTQHGKNIYLDTKFNLLWCQGAELGRLHFPRGHHLY